jgi:hypothetical protein
MAEVTSLDAVRPAAREGLSETAAKLRELGFDVRGLGDDHEV